MQSLQRNKFHRADFDEAIEGRTGIDCFDHWCAELKSTGYLHNHARMWFASIWIFTLRLPWELGADFFLRHLIDGDPAANTLSWRWVGGLHTKGKTYLARASNIAQFTGGRFEPTGQLAMTSEPLIEDIDHPVVPLPLPQPLPQGDYLLVDHTTRLPARTLHLSVHQLEYWVCYLCHHFKQSELVLAFERGAVGDAIARSADKTAALKCTQDWSAALIEAAQTAGANQVITPMAAVGPVATHLDTAKTDLAKAGISSPPTPKSLRHAYMATRHQGFLQT